MPSMSDEPLTRAVLTSTLAEFHQTVFLPDVRRIVGEVVGEAIGEFRREVNGHFDDIYRRFERLETEYASVKAGLPASRRGWISSSSGTRKCSPQCTGWRNASAEWRGR